MSSNKLDLKNGFGNLAKIVVPVLTMMLIFSLFSGMAVAQTNESIESGSTTINIGFEKEIDKELIENIDGEIETILEQINVVSIEVSTDTADKVLNNWEEKSSIEYVEEDESSFEVQGQEIPWGINRIDVPQAHDTSQGDGVDVAVLDDGIDPDHETLEVYKRKDFTGEGGFGDHGPTWQAP